MADQFNDSIPAVTNQITEDVADIAETLGYIKDVFQASCNLWSDTVATNIKPKVMGDADNDTKIQCEETADEDIIRFDIGGTEQITIQDGKIEPTTANDVDLGSSTKEFKNLYLEGSVTIDDIAQGKDVTAALHRKILNIGDWDMDATASVNIAHGLTQSKIRSFYGQILDDGSGGWPLTTSTHLVCFTGATYITLTRISGGDFDSVNFNSTGFNRGWIIIEYVD